MDENWHDLNRIIIDSVPRAESRDDLIQFSAIHIENDAAPPQIERRIDWLVGMGIIEVGGDEAEVTEFGTKYRRGIGADE